MGNNRLDPLKKWATGAEDEPPQPQASPAPEASALEGLEAVAAESAAEAVRAAVQQAVKAALQEAVEDIRNAAKETLRQAVEESVAFPAPSSTPAGHNTRPHAFVVMPFGKKKSADGTLIDFNAIYNDLIKPALEEAGFEPFRADEETTSGDILTDMFQELLLADLVVCDLSIDNANVFYELGVRHAFRKRGVVHIQSGRAYMPFDVFNVRTVPYHTGEDGRPDPQYLEKDIRHIARVCRDTYASDRDAVHSPVFNLLSGLREPDRKALRTPLATGFWREYNEWKQRVAVAERQKLIGDIMLLTEEIGNPLIKEEAIAQAGKALRGLGRHELALQQYRQGLELNPANKEFRRQEAFHLNRLGRVDEAIVKLESLLRDDPRDIEAISYLGRIYKDMWVSSWRGLEEEEQRLREAFDASHWLIKAIHTYLKGFYYDLNQYYPGINALTLSIALDDLAARFGEDDDPDIQSIRALLPNLQGTLELALEHVARREDSDYWTLVSLAELLVLTAKNENRVRRAYKRALTAARKNIFYLESSIEQLEILRALALRPAFVQQGIEVLRAEIHRIRREQQDDDTQVTPERERVFLFTGHRIDPPDIPARKRRFPPEMENEARRKIDAVLAKYNTGEKDLAVTAGAACGGEILFIEACLERDMPVAIHLPFSEPQYIKDYVAPAGEQWVERFYNLRNHPKVEINFQFEHVGKPKRGDDPDKRNNRWALYSSLVLGIDHLRLIALWDGKVAADDRDGMIVSHMVDAVRRMGGYVEHINTTKFDYWKAGGKVGAALDKLAALE